MSRVKQTGILSDTLDSLDPILGFSSDYPIAVFLVVLVISLIVAKISTTTITTLLDQFTRRIKIHWNIEVNRMLDRPVFWTLMLT